MFGLMICGASMVQMRVAYGFCTRWHCQKGKRNEQLRQTLTHEEQKCSHMPFYAGSPTKSLSR